MKYKLTIKVEEKEGPDWVEKWSEITECGDVKMGASTTVHNGNKENRRYEINVECKVTPG